MLRNRVILAAATATFAVLPAHAVTFTSGAYDTNVSLQATSAVGGSAAVLAIASVGGVSGSGAPSYDFTGGAASVNQAATLASNALGNAGETLHAGIVSTEAQSTAPTQSSASGTATLANVSIGMTNKLLTDLFSTSLLGLTADMITSTSTAGLDAGGNLFATGSTALTNLGLTGSLFGTTTFAVGAFANAAANTVVLSLTGLTVTLNEQLKSQSATGISQQTNAIHVALSNYQLDGVGVSGDVILGHSEAAVTGAVPEPGTWATMLAGFAVLGVVMRRRPKSALLAA